MIVTTRDRRQAPAGTVLHVAGEVDTYAADDLRRYLGLLPEEPGDVLLVDLSAVTFMGCTALSTLAEAQTRLGPRLVVGARSTVVSRLLELTGLTPFFARRAGSGARPLPDGLDAGPRDAVPPATRPSGGPDRHATRLMIG
jgi:anti-anti-sigma factor